jgi:gamma-glutamyl hydrolase
MLSKLVVLLPNISFFSFITLARGHRTPVVGILAEPITTPPHNNTEYMIAASYVKWLEVGGARSIPIPYDASPEQVKELFPLMDGILFPGGGGKVLSPAAKQLWELAFQANSQEPGSFPIWGTCLGFEYLLMLASDRDDILEGGYDAENISLPLLRVDSTSKIYRGIEAILQYNITLNNHLYGITPHRFRRNTQLVSMFDITSISQDLDGKYFVASIEAKDPDIFPYYGVQYHPEKNAFEYATYPGSSIPYEAIDHSPSGILLSFHLASFFVNLTRVATVKRPIMLTDVKPPVYSYTHKVGIKFQEYYIIPNATDYFSQQKHRESENSAEVFLTS